ncbi:hypothetical protein PGT21_004417 [Puccinia graminis f. sp. tritici]|uniref:Uncharacterized protein n=1 Tax=Puccinia graminis f. sp. tritici TaxID=56615 RepID=A0A5B0R089_PUCGR|nr:hypothetical protein PGT21_004417 [Puccinia graminis f. sp. tritici]KAA1118455.1 hypothetical protein PGTUg99_008091 [Puccinia graminis f. sp. tritici]
MFSANWIQRSHYFLYAVIVMTLLPSVQLLESHPHSIVRRSRGNESIKRCDLLFTLNGPDGHARCHTADRSIYSCDFRDCPQFNVPNGFSLRECRAIQTPTTAQEVQPFSYKVEGRFIEARDASDTYYKCSSQANQYRKLSCNSCLLVSKGS